MGMIQVIRRIAQVKQRLVEIAGEIEELEQSDVNTLRLRAEEVEAKGRDLLAEMAQGLDEGLKQARELLEALA